MKRTKMLRNQKGFTLIEIIAVIIIMGILAAVAVPKFFSMQEDAKIAALNGALSEAAARFNHAFSRYILDFKTAPYDVENSLADPSYDDKDYDYLGADPTDKGTDIGDFIVTWNKVDPDKVVIVVTSVKNQDWLAGMTDDQKKKEISGVGWRAEKGSLP